MKKLSNHPPLRLRVGQRGFSIVELMVAMVVAVFLLAGLFQVLQGNMNTSSDQTALAQLQDNERFAMQVYTNMIESAGYYPTLTPAGAQNVLALALPVDGSAFPTAGQGISGGTNGAGGDMLMSRFATNPNDGVSSCLGNTNPNPAGTIQPYVFKNQLQVTANVLTCSDGNGVNAVPLVSGVNSVTLWWGVNTGSTIANGGCPANTYLATSDYITQTPLIQTNVCSVKVILKFINPMYQLIAGGPITPGQPQYVNFTKVIAVMVKAGP
jgi:type IV pilus assembly protein PilW